MHLNSLDQPLASEEIRQHYEWRKRITKKIMSRTACGHSRSNQWKMETIHSANLSFIKKEGRGKKIRPNGYDEISILNLISKRNHNSFKEDKNNSESMPECMS